MLQRSVTVRSLIVTFLMAMVIASGVSAPAAAKAGHNHRDKHKVVSKRERHHKKPKLVELTSLVATVDGISVAPEQAPQVKSTRLHRPLDTATADETQAAGAVTPATSSGSGMLSFLVAALLLASLAAWLIRQVGPLRD